MARPGEYYRKNMTASNVAPLLYPLNSVGYHQNLLPWRLPNMSFPPRVTSPPPSSIHHPSDNLHILPITSLPLVSHPIHWSRSDVVKWLEWAQEEFSLNGIDTEKFCMNGKGLLMLTKQDFKDRAAYAGDVLYEMLEHLKRKDLYPLMPEFSPGSPLSPRNHQSTSPINQSSPRNHISTSPVNQSSPRNRQSTSPVNQSVHSTTYQQQLCHKEGECIQDTLFNKQSAEIKSQENRTVREMKEERAERGINQVNNHHTVIVQHIPTTEPILHSPMSTSNSGSGSVSSDEDCHSNSLTMATSDYDQNDNEIIPCESLSRKPDADYSQAMPLDLSTISLPVKPNSDCRLLWEFLYCLLSDKTYQAYIKWEDVSKQTFRIQKPGVIAYLWGKQKNRKNMTYDKLSRALRYYYKMKILQKEDGQKLTYRFLKKAEDLQPSPEYSKLKTVIQRDRHKDEQNTVKQESETE